MKTTRERAEEQRVLKLEMIREQVAEGRLIIREMTAAERTKYPPCTAPPAQEAEAVLDPGPAVRYA